jgi:hypothetical protein
MKTTLLLSAGLGAAVLLGVTGCGQDEPTDYDAEPTHEVEEGEAPDCIYLFDETETADDDGDLVGTYCRQE